MTVVIESDHVKYAIWLILSSKPTYQIWRWWFTAVCRQRPTQKPWRRRWDRAVAAHCDHLLLKSRLCRFSYLLTYL